MKKLIYLFALTILFIGSVAAQSGQITTVNTNELSTFDLVGAQSAEGVYDKESQTYVGNTFVLNGANEKFSVNLTISMDYRSAPVNSASSNLTSMAYQWSFLNPDAPSEVTKGMWTLTVYKDAAYYGTLYGEIRGGAINWQMSRPDVIESRITEVKMMTTGGIDAFAEGYESDGAENFMTAFTSFVPSGQATTTAKLDITF